MVHGSPSKPERQQEITGAPSATDTPDRSSRLGHRPVGCGETTSSTARRSWCRRSGCCGWPWSTPERWPRSGHASTGRGPSSPCHSSSPPRRQATTRVVLQRLAAVKRKSTALVRAEISARVSPFVIADITRPHVGNAKVTRFARTSTSHGSRLIDRCAFAHRRFFALQR